MAVTAGDPPILVVDAELGLLIAADLATAINGLPLGVMVAAAVAGAATFTSHPPSGFGTTWWVLGPLLMSCLLVVCENVFHPMTNSS